MRIKKVSSCNLYSIVMSSQLSLHTLQNIGFKKKKEEEQKSQERMATRKGRPTKPHFFKPLLPGFQHQLVIPESFYVKYMKDKKAGKAALRTTMGKFWHVKLNGRVIEDDGWQEFCEDQELEVGHFLVFGLVEAAAADVVGFAFDVLVFDQSTCQRDYPSFLPNDSAGKFVKEKDINFELKAESSVPQHPCFAFSLSYYSAKKSILYIPMKFARENGLCNRYCNIVLVNGEGKEWVAGLGFKPHNEQVYINQGWSAFRYANSLKAGDLYVFELIQNGKKPVLKITRRPEGLKLKPVTKKQPTNNTSRAQADSWSRKPDVYVTMQPSYIKLCLLRLPDAFAKMSGMKSELPQEIIVRNEREETWTVSPWRSQNGSINLGRGWTAFATSNGIQVGHVLKLQLIKKGKKPIVRISGVRVVPKTNKSYKKINQDVNPIEKHSQS